MAGERKTTTDHETIRYGLRRAAEPSREYVGRETTTTTSRSSTRTTRLTASPARSSSSSSGNESVLGGNR